MPVFRACNKISLDRINIIRDREMDNGGNTNNKKINWNIGIPIIIWIACVFLGELRLVLETNSEKGILQLIAVFNSNTFATFISIIACMWYQFFSEEKQNLRDIRSGLSTRYMPVTIVATVVYFAVACFDAALPNYKIMTIICFIVNIVYVICFFKVFTYKPE